MNGLTVSEIVNIYNYFELNGNTDDIENEISKTKKNPEFVTLKKALTDSKTKLKYFLSLDQTEDIKKEINILLSTIDGLQNDLKPYDERLNELELKKSKVAPFELDSVLKSKIDGYGGLILRNIKNTKRAIIYNGGNITYKGLKLSNVNDKKIKALSFLFEINEADTSYNFKNGFNTVLQTIKANENKGD